MRYRNEYIKKWSEIAASNRYRLDQSEHRTYDAVATHYSPEPLVVDDWVEIKACATWIDNGDQYGTCGRWHITRSTHEDLCQHGGYYCLVVYDTVREAGERIMIIDMEIVKATELEPLLPSTGRAMKLPHNAVFEVDDAYL